MLDVRMGDAGPRVVLLQVLLNRRGGPIRVDGVFGPQTAHAVSDARRRLMGVAGPHADPDLWMVLLREQRLCGIDAFDMGEERFQQGATIVRSAGSRVVETGAMCNGVPAVIQGIVNHTMPPGGLGVLRTWGHGNRGRWLSFTVGEVVHTTLRDPQLGAQIAAERGSYIDPARFDEMRSTLAPVRDCFSPVGIYEHHGCSLGRVPTMREMMRRLAAFWNVPATVAVGTQFIPYDGSTAMRFQGQTYTAYPGGSQSAWIAQVQAGERMSR